MLLEQTSAGMRGQPHRTLDAFSAEKKNTLKKFTRILKRLYTATRLDFFEIAPLATLVPGVNSNHRVVSRDMIYRYLLALSLHRGNGYW